MVLLELPRGSPRLRAKRPGADGAGSPTHSPTRSPGTPAVHPAPPLGALRQRGSRVHGAGAPRAAWGGKRGGAQPGSWPQVTPPSLLRIWTSNGCVTAPGTARRQPGDSCVPTALPLWRQLAGHGSSGGGSDRYTRGTVDGAQSGPQPQDTGTHRGHRGYTEGKGCPVWRVHRGPAPVPAGTTQEGKQRGGVGRGPGVCGGEPWAVHLTGVKVIYECCRP